MVNLHWSFFYLLFGVPLVALELWGVRRKAKGDTISENVWWLERHFWPLRFVIALFLAWLGQHFWNF